MILDFQTTAAAKNDGRRVHPRLNYSPEAYLVGVLIAVGVALCALFVLWS